MEAAPLITDVADTARWVAAHRAAESARPDALFHDPLAARLAGEHGRRIAAVMGGASGHGWPMNVRTRLIDDEVATALADSSALRARLTAGMYLDTDADDILGRLDHAVRLAGRSEGLLRKLRDARQGGRLPPYAADLPAAALAAGVLSETEAEQLRAYERALRAAIDVDDFAPDELWARASGGVREQDAA